MDNSSDINSDCDQFQACGDGDGDGDGDNVNEDAIMVPWSQGGERLGIGFYQSGKDKSLTFFHSCHCIITSEYYHIINIYLGRTSL